MPDLIATSTITLPAACPVMPYTVTELAFGTNGRTRLAKTFANGRPTEYLTDDEIAVWGYVQQLEREVRGSAGFEAATAEIEPQSEIEATVEETAVPLTAESNRALMGELLGALPPLTATDAREPVEEPIGISVPTPNGFVGLAGELVPAPTPELEPPVPTIAPAASEEVGTDGGAEVGTETSTPKSAKRQAVEAALKATPNLSNAALGERCAVSDEFVRKTRKEMEARGELAPVATVIGRDGHEQNVATKAADAA